MGTNYDAGDRHLGKVSSTGYNARTFFFAVQPGEALELAKKHGVANEYGDKLTYVEFCRVLNSCRTWDASTVGQEFC